LGRFGSLPWINKEICKNYENWTNELKYQRSALWNDSQFDDDDDLKHIDYQLTPQDIAQKFTLDGICITETKNPNGSPGVNEWDTRDNMLTDTVWGSTKTKNIWCNRPKSSDELYLKISYEKPPKSYMINPKRGELQTSVLIDPTGESQKKHNAPQNLRLYGKRTVDERLFGEDEENYEYANHTYSENKRRRVSVRENFNNYIKNSDEITIRPYKLPDRILTVKPWCRSIQNMDYDNEAKLENDSRTKISTVRINSGANEPRKFRSYKPSPSEQEQITIDDNGFEHRSVFIFVGRIERNQTTESSNEIIRSCYYDTRSIQRAPVITICKGQHKPIMDS